MRSTRLPDRESRQQRVRSFAVVLVAVHTAWLSFSPVILGDDASEVRIVSAAIAAISGMFCLAMGIYHAMRATPILRPSWYLFAVGGFATSLVPSFDLAHRQGSFLLGDSFSATQVAACLGALAIVLGCIMLTSFPRAGAARARSYMDAITAGSVVSFVSWSFLRVHVSFDASMSFFDRTLLIGVILVDFVLLTFAAVLVLLPRRKARPAPFVSTALAIGLAVAAGGDFVNIVMSLDSKLGRDVWDLSCTMTPLFFALAITYPQPIVRTHHTPVMLRYGMQLLTSGAATVVLLVTLSEARSAHGLDAVSEWIASCVVAFVLIRHMIAWLEERWLSNALEKKVSSQAVALGRREHLFHALVQRSADVIAIVRLDGGFEYTSPSMETTLGYRTEAIASTTLLDIVANNEIERVEALIEMSRAQPGETLTSQWTLLREDGEPRLFDVNIRNLLDDVAVGGFVLNLRDITERKRLEGRLAHQALHDGLTHLANRTMLRMRIEGMLEKWVLQREPFSLIAIDVDDFKSINDSIGHVAGDAVLKTISQRMHECTRRGDVVGRLGADEFAILVAGLSPEDHETKQFVERILESLSKPMQIGERYISVRVSVGLACVADKVHRPDDLLRNAELAMHAAKETARGSYVFFQRDMHDVAIQRIELEADLRSALQLDGLQLFYQPTIDVVNGRMNGFEALARWPHPSRGYVPPVEFIPVAEESGLIVPLGKWVLGQACAQMAHWQTRYPDMSDLKMHVNLSARQLDEPYVVPELAEIITQSGVAPSSIVFEMTESILSKNENATREKLEALVEFGCELAIDDFGTGYSSLSYLQKFPMSILKIDRSFISDICDSSKKQQIAMVRTIIELAHVLNVQTVAEGVETFEQLVRLRELGCDVAQGFYVARPAPAEDIKRLITSSHAQNLPLVNFSTARVES